ncbi:hypothetical protein [Myxococcus stipitatus]|uniref:hypothetical protein n=1 Tax=Myxococcus stipitatus TaxID=83455 RepID=UPI001F285BA0|nr:hypothetical protein [Myxococcus stipitatus]
MGPGLEGGGSPIAGSCSQRGEERCNNCDDDGDGLVDENVSNDGPMVAGACQSSKGCTGTSTCTNGVLQCVYQTGQRRPCGGEFDEVCANASAACLPDGTLGACQPPVPGVELCNGCDDDYDGVVDNPPGQTGPLVRECQSSAGSCPGSSQTCVKEFVGGYTIRYWGACTAPAEICNGMDDDCDGSVDESDICRPDQQVCACQPMTCAQQGKNCGTIDDGCGWPLNCGTCVPGTTCGGGGTPNVCAGACTPLTQEQACQGKCGTVPDGCNGFYSCGGCNSPQTCGGGGTPNVCGCSPTPYATACAGKNCGSVPDNCGGTYTCGSTGTCTPPQTCGGGGAPNVCGCTIIPKATACAGKNCGLVSNGCGGTHDCGTCSGVNSCGGGGAPNVCGCTPLTKAEACEEQECGSASNGCGGSMSCGTCIGGTTCKGGICEGNPGSLSEFPVSR